MPIITKHLNQRIIIMCRYLQDNRLQELHIILNTLTGLFEYTKLRKQVLMK